VVRPGKAAFSRPAECRLAIVANDCLPDAMLTATADQIVTVTEIDEPSLVAALAAAG
jgi:hypothetical protein